MTDTIIVVEPETVGTTGADVWVPSLKVRSSDVVVRFNAPAGVATLDLVDHQELPLM